MNYRNIYHLVSTQANIFKDKTFAIFPDEKTSITYKELHREASVLAAHLISSGITSPKRIALLAKKSRAGAIAYVGSLFTGSLILFVDERLNQTETQQMLTQYKADVLLHDSNFENLAQEIAQNLEKKPQLIVIDQTPKQNHATELLSFINHANPDDPAICVYTSGSTGKPKGIISTHKNIFFGARSLQESLYLTPKDRVLSVTPFSGTNGQIFTFWSPFYAGGSGVYYQGMFTPFKVFKQMDLYKVTWMNATPTYYSLINSSKLKATQFDLTSLRFVRTSSAPLPELVQNEFENNFQIPMVDSLGLSETTGQIFVNSPDLRLRKKRSVGRPVRTGYKLIDSSTSEEIHRANIVGEIIVKCDGLMLGYLDDPETTAEVIKDGWLWTGDLGYYDRDGFIFLKGRKKDIAIIGGKNVSLTEVDEILYGHPQITNAISFGVPEDISGEKIISFVTTTNSSQELSSQELLKQDIFNYCRAQISSYKIPKEIYVVDSFPLGGGGKIIRAKVKEWYLDGKRTW